jgi:hypothetical protein
MDYLNCKDRIIVFCKNSMGSLNELLPFLDKVEKPFILITAMEDAEFPAQIDGTFIDKVYNNKHFKHWFAINKITHNDDKFTSIPYGLDYWTLTRRHFFQTDIQTIEEQNAHLESITNKNVHFSRRIMKCFCNFHLNPTDDRYFADRRNMHKMVDSKLTEYQTEFIPRNETYKLMSKYAFVISPFGHGFDCIRTFEALCLGCIVIMKKSFLDIIYTDLPVLIVDKWSDITEELLINTIHRFSTKKFNYEKLKMSYWIDLVNSKWE